MSDLTKGLLIAGGCFVAYKLYEKATAKEGGISKDGGGKRPAPRFDPADGNANAPQKGDTNWQDVTVQGIKTGGSILSDVLAIWGKGDSDSSSSDEYIDDGYDAYDTYN